MGHKHGKFNCLSCKRCCSLLVVPITEADFNRLLIWKEKKSIPDKEFFLFFTFGSYDDIKIPQLILRSPCPFLNEEGCKIYPYRPDVCKKYPFEILESKEVDQKDRLLERHAQGLSISLSIQHKNCPATKNNQVFSKEFLNTMFDVNIRYDLELTKAIQSKYSWFHKIMAESGVDEQLKPTNEQIMEVFKTDYEFVQDKVFLFDADVSNDLRSKLIQDILLRNNVPTYIQLFEKGYEKRIIVLPKDLYMIVMKKIMESSKGYFKGAEKLLFFASYQGLPISEKFNFLPLKWDKILINDYNIRDAIAKKENLFKEVPKF